MLHLLGAIRLEDQLQKRCFLLGQLSLLLFFAQVRVDPHKVLALVFAEVEDLECSIVLAAGLKLPLHAYHPFAGGVNGKFAQVADDPLAAQLFGHGGGGATAAEEVGHEVPWVRG